MGPARRPEAEGEISTSPGAGVAATTVPPAFPGDRIRVALGWRIAIFVLAMLCPGTGLALAGEFRSAIGWFLVLNVAAQVAVIGGVQLERGALFLLAAILTGGLFLSAARGVDRLSKGRPRHTARRGNVLCVSLIAVQIAVSIGMRAL